MTSPSSRLHDGLAALALSGSFGLAAAATVPAVLSALPAEARQLPLPLPVFAAVLAMQLTLFYGLLGWAGLRLARASGLEPTPAIGAVKGRVCGPVLVKWLIAATAGLTSGALLVAAVAVIKHFAPGTLPTMLHPPGAAAALLASLAGSIGEEILCRLFLLSLLVWTLPKSQAGLVAAIAISAVAFGALHAPGFVMLAGGLDQMSPLGWLWVIGLNGALGVVFGCAYLRGGIGCAIVAHFATDLVWHVASAIAAN